MERAKIILKLMKEKNINMAELSRRSNLPYTTITTILKKGIKTGSYVNVKSMCEALEITPDMLEEMYTSESKQGKKSTSLNNEQNRLLEQFSKLNDIGKEEAIKRIEELTYINKYTIPDPKIKLDA